MINILKLRNCESLHCWTFLFNKYLEVWYALCAHCRIGCVLFHSFIFTTFAKSSLFFSQTCIVPIQKPSTKEFRTTTGDGRKSIPKSLVKRTYFRLKLTPEFFYSTWWFNRKTDMEIMHITSWEICFILSFLFYQKLNNLFWIYIFFKFL